MCLAVPGRVLSLAGEDPLSRSGRVDFGGVVKEISFAFAPEAGIDDYVPVHVGFAIAVIDAVEAERVFTLLSEIGELTGNAAAP
jgi:hydrogenase expression/formation protein HypC